MSEFAIEIFTEIAVPAFQIAFTFGFGSYLVVAFLKMALGGKVKL